MIKEIRDFTDKYDHNQYILSCRIAAFNYVFERFSDIEVADFDDNQIKQFIGNWFESNKTAARTCWDRINADKSIRELASVPLLLTLLCLSFDEDGGFPQNRAELYREALYLLLKKWDESKKVNRDEIYKHLTLENKIDMFSIIATESFNKNKYFLPQGHLERRIFRFMKELPGANEGLVRPDAESVLKSIEGQHGIFMEFAKRIFAFSHLTFQEYFVANYVITNWNKGYFEKLVESHASEDRWREVFLLTASMAENADEFILTMKKGIDSMVVQLNIRDYLSIIQQMVRKKAPYPDAYCRLIALIFGLLPVAVFRARARGPSASERIIWLTKSLDLNFVSVLGPAIDPRLKRHIR